MTTKFLYKTSDLKRLVKIWLFIVTSLAVYIISSQTHANSIEFDNNILGWFPGITWYINHAHFNYGWNDFYGTFFLLPAWYATDTITLGGTTKTCTRQIRWLYYNNQRGYRLWPLDKNTLDTLKTLDTWYNNLNISGWWYTLCSGSSPDEIYWQITHDRYSWTIFNMIAWVTYDFTNNTYTWWLSWTLRFFNNTTWYFRDQWGWVASFRGTWVPSLNQTWACTWVVLSWVYYNRATTYSITQTRNWLTRSPTTAWIYAASPTIWSCNFKCITWYMRSGTSSSCQLIPATCWDWIIGIWEQCDRASSTWRACNNDCTLIVPSCTGWFSPISWPAPLTASFWIWNQAWISRSIKVSTGGASIYLFASIWTWWSSFSTSSVLNNTWTYMVTLTWSNPFSGWLDCIVTWSITVYDACGNGNPNAWEQCDDWNNTNWDGCSSSCVVEIPSCTLSNNSPKYTGQVVSFTSTWWRAIFESINFWNNNWTWTLSGSWSINTGHTYANTWTYTWTVTVHNQYSWLVKSICTTSVTILWLTWITTQTWSCIGSLLINHSVILPGTTTSYLQTLSWWEWLPVYSRTYSPTTWICVFACNSSYTRSGGQCIPECSNGSINTWEQCDDWNLTNWDGCDSSCMLEMPSCTWLTATPNSWYSPLPVVFSWVKNSRTNYTLNFWDWSSTWTFVIPLTKTYSLTWTFIYSLTWANAYSWAFNCISTWTIIVSQATWTYCGDWTQQTPNSWNIYEQCDDWNQTNWDGCSSSCTVEMPSCTLSNNSPKYTGQVVSFTSTWWRAIFESINFWDNSWIWWGGNIPLSWSWTINTWHIYTISWSYTWTVTVHNQYSWSVKSTCTTPVTILSATWTACGNNILELDEQCDDWNLTSWDGCSSSCILETPTCTITNDSPKYTGQNVTFTWNSSSRSKITELTFWNGNWVSVTSNSSNYTVAYSYINAWSYTATLIATSNITWTIVKTWTCTTPVVISWNIFTWTLCRSWWINLSWTCTLIWTWNTTVTWTIPSWTTFNIPWNIIIYGIWANTGWYLNILWINSVWISYWNRDWILIPPTILTAWSCSAPANVLTSISSWLSNPVVILEFQAWASWSTITSNQAGWYFTIKVKVNSWTVWNTYRIFRSAQCSIGREKVYIDELCILDANKMCEFRTNKLSYFNIVSNVSLWWWGTPMIVGTIPRLRNAQIDKIYMSDPFTIANFNDVTLATVTKWMLYVNWAAIWTSGYVQNWDELNIELYSSKKYDTTISSKITVWSIAATFYITTMLEWDDNSNDLSNLQKIRIMSIFNLLIDLYSDNPAKEQEFLYTLRSMLIDKLEVMDETDDAYSTFEYLLSLIESRLLTSWIDESNYVAANCKEYEIQFEENEEAYYSPDFKKEQYFSTRESLIRYIDSKNPWDCRINTYWSNYVDATNKDENKHIAPNGKIYNIDNNDNGYTSPDLSSTKYFDTLQGLRAYLNINNPAITIRSHEIDGSFDAVSYTAPNNKIYKIYKTDKWYMSYKLMKIRYFTSLDSIKLFIKNNNRI